MPKILRHGLLSPPPMPMIGAGGGGMTYLPPDFIYAGGGIVETPISVTAGVNAYGSPSSAGTTTEQLHGLDIFVDQKVIYRTGLLRVKLDGVPKAEVGVCASPGGNWLRLVFAIPSGSAVTIEAAQNGTGALTFNVFARPIKAADPAFVAPPSLLPLVNVSPTNLNAGTGLGNIIASANTGAWAELTPALATAVTYMSVYADRGTGNGSRNPAYYGVDVGIGAAGAETVLISNLLVPASGSSQVNQLEPGGFFRSAPAGSRLVTRANRLDGGTTGATDIFQVNVSAG